VSASAGNGFIANTDFGWFSHFLHRDEPPDEVDFWQPVARQYCRPRRRVGY